MLKTKLAGGTVHEKLPADLQQAILSTPAAKTTWEATTPLARNEWICLIITAIKPETRTRRIERARSQLSKGQRRPCCWAGCIHRIKSVRNNVK